MSSKLRMKDVGTLVLQSNQLRGDIPDALGSLVQFTVLDLQVNGCSGKIPEAMVYLTSCDQLVISKNLSVLKRCVPKTLAFALGLCLRSQTRCFKTRVLGRRLPNGKPQRGCDLGTCVLKR